MWSTQQHFTAAISMNYFTTQISDRLESNDPSLTELSIRRYPLTAMSSNEIELIVKSLQHNRIVKSVDISIPSISHNWNDTDITAIENNEDIRCSSSSGTGSLYKYLFDMIRINSSIDSLTIRDIKSDDAWVALSNGMRLNTKIRVLALGNTSNIWNLELSLIACQSLKNILLYARNLQCLHLKSFAMPSLECLKHVCVGLKQCKNLRELVFHSIECSHLDMMISAITQSTSPIQKLAFIDCNFDCEETENNDGKMNNPLVNMLSGASKCTLQELRINECMVTRAVIGALCRGIEQNSTLKLLDLSGCDLLSPAGKQLSDMLCTNKSLLHLNLEENILGDQGIIFLAAGLAANSTLQSLDLKANQCSELGCDHIAESLKAHGCQLRTLTLSTNPINDIGAKHLGDALAENNCLESIDLDSCMIGDNGLQLLCRGLAFNSSLKEINLSNNWCKKGHYISKMLSHNKALDSIDMSSCHISDETLEQLLGSLRDGANSSLKALHVSFNAFTNRGARAIAQMLLGGNKIEVLSAQYNSFDSDGLRSIAAALSSSFYLGSFYFWNGQWSTKRDVIVIDEIDHFLKLNRAGRRAILNHQPRTAIWANIIKRSDMAYGPSAVFTLLREMPVMMKILKN